MVASANSVVIAGRVLARSKVDASASLQDSLLALRHAHDLFLLLCATVLLLLLILLLRRLLDPPTPSWPR